MIESLHDQILSLDDVDRLFNEYSMAVESNNVVAFYYAKQIFTDKHFSKLKGGEHYNCYSPYCGDCCYLYRSGFRLLATYYNFDILQSLVVR